MPYFLYWHCVLTRALSFRQINPFGSTIRPFTHNVADMKKLAARDFEDILQVRRVLIQLSPMPNTSHHVPVLYSLLRRLTSRTT